MITTPTTFVVGAGCSVPYGLPPGGAIIEMARSVPSPHDLARLAQRGGMSESALARVLLDMSRDPADSIDEFLFRRQGDEESQLGGRLMIASLLGDSIRGQRKAWHDSPPFSHDWLKVLLCEMRAGASTLQEFVQGNRHVRFVTFNFDSMIEDALLLHSRTAYRCSEEEASIALDQFKVIHVHGRLPSLDGKPNSYWVQNAIPAISIVHDRPDPETGAKAIDAARKALEAATVICFLGFGYEPRNIEKLAVKQMLQQRRSVEVYGSALKLSKAQRLRAADRLGLTGQARLRMGTSTEDAQAFLQRYHVLKG